ncbi:MAG TPA: hypothetical protein VJM47_02115 [Nitrosospira sp.]|nr:hypothetical protein [Nitrosospira sp.]
MSEAWSAPQSINNDILRVDRPHPSHHIPRFVPFNLRRHVLNLPKGLFRAPFSFDPSTDSGSGRTGGMKDSGRTANPLSYFSPGIDRIDYS